MVCVQEPLLGADTGNGMGMGICVCTAFVEFQVKSCSVLWGESLLWKMSRGSLTRG